MAGAMLDLRPVAYVISLLVAALGASMLFPLIVDLASGDPNASAFSQSALIVVAVGALVAMATSNSPRSHLSS